MFDIFTHKKTEKKSVVKNTSFVFVCVSNQSDVRVRNFLENYLLEYNFVKHEKKTSSSCIEHTQLE